MNPLLRHFTSPEWTSVVKALLHSLWQATSIAALLGLALRRLASPAKRYCCSLAALAVVAGASLITWGVLNQPDAIPSITDASITAAQIQNSSTRTTLPAFVVTVTRSETTSHAAQWTAWVALAWIAGAAAMLLRAAMQVAGAERVRRSTRPLENSQVKQLLVDAQRAMQLTRKIQVAVTNKLTSPAVVGVLVPTLILPLSLITALTPEQLRFVLLHELAHIRRGDYFANLFQLFTEALLFFNPAVWWISHQVRREREACCDALAIALSNAPADYARTLVSVAENIIEPMPVAATTFGNGHKPSSLTERVQRMLVPGYRPSLRLTWRAMLAALFAGGTLLILSAVGTQLTVAAILSPQQRIDQIERKMTEYGETPEVASEASEKLRKVKVSGRVRMADGSNLPNLKCVNMYIQRKNIGEAYSARLKTNGMFSTSVWPGLVYAALDAPGFAPSVVGPVDTVATNHLEKLDLVLDRGFDTTIVVTDADTKQHIGDARLKVQFWIRDAGFGIGTPQELKTDKSGTAKLFHCSESVAVTLVVNAPGYEIVEQRIEKLNPREPIQIKLWRGLAVAGVVLNKADNRPLAGATVRMIYEKGRTEARYNWTDPMRVLAQTDAAGRFTVNQLRRGSVYWLGISAPGHESVIIKRISPGGSGLTAKLGPELIVRGRVKGSFDGVQRIDNEPALYRSWSEVFDTKGYGSGAWVSLHVTNGVAAFQFTNRIPGLVKLNVKGRTFERQVDAPVKDWFIDLSAVEAMKTNVPKREVVFRFGHPSGVPPQGTVSVTVPDSLEPSHLTAHTLEKEIVNGEVRAEIPIGGRTSIEPKRTVGYWFKSDFSGVLVTNGSGPMVIEIPVVPAGAVYAQARNADGTAAGGMFFGVGELKRARNLDQSDLLDSGGDSFSGDAPRKWVSGPLPLGGTYQVYAWRGNSFCVSKPIPLTDAKPDAEVELQFNPGKSFEGVLLDPDGKPVQDAELKMSFTLANGHSFGLKSTFTDERGRFRMENATPNLGEYFAEVDAPGLMAERVKLEFESQPQTIRVKRGRTMAGRVVEVETGYAIPGAEVRALDDDQHNLPMVTTHTDAHGRFEFTTLGSVNYTLYVQGGELRPRKTIRADGNTNITLAVKLYPWSKLRPKPPMPETNGKPGSVERNGREQKSGHNRAGPDNNQKLNERNG